MNWTERYKKAHHEWAERTGPGFFKASGGETMKVAYPKVTSSNGLRRAIINFMVWSGHHLEATNNMGRPVAKSYEKFNILSGRLEKISNGIEWQKGSGIRGSSDAKGHLRHPKHLFAIPIYIEIKYGKDTQSDEQIEYEAKINATGGIYLIAKTIDQFFLSYDKLLKQLDNDPTN